MSFTSVVVLIVVIIIIAILVAKAFGVKLFSKLGEKLKTMFSKLKPKKKEKESGSAAKPKSVFNFKKAPQKKQSAKVAAGVGEEKLKAEIKQDITLGKVVGETAKEKAARDPNKVSKVTLDDFKKNNIVLPKESGLMQQAAGDTAGGGSVSAVSAPAKKPSGGFRMPSFDMGKNDFGFDDKDDIKFDDDPFSDVDLDALLAELEKEEKEGKSEPVVTKPAGSFGKPSPTKLMGSDFGTIGEDTKVADSAPKTTYDQKPSDDYFVPQLPAVNSGFGASGIGAKNISTIESRFEQVFGRNSDVMKNQALKEVLINEVLGGGVNKSVRARREERRKRLKFMQ